MEVVNRQQTHMTKQSHRQRLERIPTEFVLTTFILHPGVGNPGHVSHGQMHLRWIVDPNRDESLREMG